MARKLIKIIYSRKTGRPWITCPRCGARGVCADEIICEETLYKRLWDI
jgi:hypothetical protein